jgi:[FeFe] hydrogenase (group B1/B3)
MVRIASQVRHGRLLEEIDRVPLSVAPRDGGATRCCVYKDRAVLKYRIMSLLGHGMEDETDELTPLSQYAAEALARKTAPSPEPSVLDIACASCTKGAHMVTDACRGCVARPCTTSCPKGAVRVVDGRARIDEEQCVNCGLCARECPFHAIIYRPVPCEQACPVDAIEKDERGRIRINREKCIACGRCLTACPFSAVMDRSQMVDVLSALQSRRRVVAAVAPAGIGQFRAPFEQLVSACKALGFDAVHEVAAGADEVARRESAELRERLEDGQAFMTSSCCPAYTEAVRRHLPGLAPYVSDTESPMVAIARRIREEDPEATVVFVGPCLAKKREASESGVIDYVLSFEELGAAFVAYDIDVQECEAEPADSLGQEIGRGFPVSGGVGAAVRRVLAEASAGNAGDAGGTNAGRRDAGEGNTGEGDAPCPLSTALIDGLDADSLRQLRRLAKNPEKPGAVPEDAAFLEVMACHGGCVGGPLAYGSAKAAAKQIHKQMAGAG